MNYAKVYKNGTSNAQKFRHFSQWVVDNHIKNIQGNEHLDKVKLRNIADVLSLDMAIGSELMKRKYIITGVVIGGSLIGAIGFINKLQKDKRET